MLAPMTNAAQLAEFPFVEELPKREKGKIAKILDVFEELERVTKERGPMIPQTLAGDFLGVSRQRVGQLMDQGRLVFHEINGERFLFLSSLMEFAKQERRGPGRPKRSLVAAAMAGGEALGEAVGRAAGLK